MAMMNPTEAQFGTARLPIVKALFVGLLNPLFVQPGSLPIHVLTTPVIEVNRDVVTQLGCGRHSAARLALS